MDTRTRVQQKTIYLLGLKLGDNVGDSVGVSVGETATKKKCNEFRCKIIEIEAMKHKHVLLTGIDCRTVCLRKREKSMTCQNSGVCNYNDISMIILRSHLQESIESWT